MNRGELERLSKEELIDLVLRLQRPEKTSRTSSKPPSSDRKGNGDRNSKPGGAKPGHEGHSRKMSDDPDVTVEHRPDLCPHCRAALAGDVAAAGETVVEKIELPEVKPIVTHHRLVALICPGCGRKVPAPEPEVAKGTPFGPRISAVAVYLKTFQHVSYERLRLLFQDLFGLTISEGGLMNRMKAAQEAFAPGAQAALAKLRQAESIASDETGVRIEALNGHHWVFAAADAVVHKAAMSRGAKVVREVLAGHRPAYWLSDRYSAQQGHGKKQQTCLAHLARHIAYGMEAGEDRVPAQLKRWLDKVFALAAQAAAMKPQTRERKWRRLDDALAEILRAGSACAVTRELLAKIANARDQLFTFCAAPGLVKVTNNQCERLLRPAVIQRKVTNGYRSTWAADMEAAARTVTDTAALTGQSRFQTILAAFR